MSDSVLECAGLTKHYGGISALDEVSASFAEGTITAVIGPNGAGKTTLLNVISGFDRAERGVVRHRGETLQGLRPDAIARRGIVRTFQHSRVFAEMTVADHVLLAVAAADEETVWSALVRRRPLRNRTRAEAALELVGLAGLQSRLAGELSFGQQKLLALASCIATDARIFLLDEPLAGIAPALIEKILAIFDDLAGRGCTVIFVEHDLMAVKMAAQRVLGMHRGKVLARGTPAEVFRDPVVLGAFLE